MAKNERFLALWWCVGIGRWALVAPGDTNESFVGINGLTVAGLQSE